MKKVANSKKVLMASEKIAKAIELEAEEILEHAEEVVKHFVPARKVKATLTMIEKMMDKEGIEVLFDKTVSREALRKTAGEEVSDKEIQEVAKAIVDAMIDELEDVLKDADDVADEVVQGCDGENPFEVESRLKGSLEKKMASKGVYCQFARKTPKPVAKKTLLEKITSK